MFDDVADRRRLKAFIVANRLRQGLEGHRELIAVSRSRKAILHGGFYQGFGVTVNTHSERSLNNKVKKLIELGCELRQRGYCEANLYCPTDEIALSACKYLGIVKGQQRGRAFSTS